MALEQKYLNVSTRAKGYVDIMMYVPDENVEIQGVTSSDVFSYSNVNSIADVRNYTFTTLATLEENLWILNGSFLNPTPGRTYNGYISNSVSDENGEFDTNPVINVQLVNATHVEQFTIILNPAVPTGYPEQITVTCYDSSNNIVGTPQTKIIENETTLPNIVYDLNLDNVARLTLEFINTVTPLRRIRVSTILFGKMVLLDKDDIVSTDYLDKCSYVPDTIPSRTFSISLNNYEKKYNIDNPENSYISLNRQTRVLARNRV